MKTLDPISHQIKKEAILQHARHLFATKGLSETSMDDIAQACHMQKASLYHYFESKHQALQELVDLGCARWSAQLKEYEKHRTLSETLQGIGERFVTDMDDPAHREFFKIIYFESHKNPAVLKAFKQSPTHNKTGLYALFERHLRGRLTSEHIAMFTTQFMGALIHYVTLSKLRPENSCPGQWSDRAYIEQLVGIFSKGLDSIERPHG